MSMELWLVEDAREVAQAIIRACEQHELPVFPARVCGSGFTANWPNATDVDGFVRTAADVGAPVVYLAQVTAEQAAAQTGKELRDRLEEVVEVEAGLVVEAVLHRLAVVSRWWFELQEITDFAAELDWADRRARAEQIARRVVDNPAFWDHGSAGRHARQDAVVRDAFPDLDERTVYEVIDLANRIDQRELQPLREQQWADQARELLGGGVKKIEIAERLGITTNVLNRILQTNLADRRAQ